MGITRNWDRLDFVTLTYSSRRKPKKKGLRAWVLFPQKKNTANHHAGLFSFEEEESRWSSCRVGVMNCFPSKFLAIVCVRDPHVFCGEKDSTNTTSKSLTREQHKRRFVCIIQWMGLNLSKSRQQGLSVAYSTPPQIQLVWKGSESIHIRIIIEYALSRSYRLTRNAYQPRSLPLAMDSNLEAFSYYPTDGSFAPSAFQPSALPII